MALSGTVSAERRRQELVALVQRDGTLQLESAAESFQVSTMTIRRDLEDLEAEGLLRRVRGGAVANVGPRPFDERRTVRASAKRAIAQKALALVPTTGAIALDASTTTNTLAAMIGPRDGLLVATNSLENFVTTRALDGVSAVLTGGQPEPTTGSLVGPVACNSARSLLYDRFFASASALDPAHGSSEVSLAEAQVKKVFAEAAREVVLCIDSAKLDRRSVAQAFPLTDVAFLVTDLEPADPRLDGYREFVEIV